MLYGCSTSENNEPQEIRADTTIIDTTNNDSENVKMADPKKRKKFMAFFSKFKELALPFRLTLTDGSSFETSGSLDAESNDTIFVKDEFISVWGILGRLKDTSSYYGFIVTYPGDGPVPILFTYDKKLNLISTESLIARGCGANCGIKHCSTTTVIEKNLSIYCADTMHYVECDAEYNEIKGSDVKYVEYLNGKIGKDGKIEMAEMVHKDLKL